MRPGDCYQLIRAAQAVVDVTPTYTYEGRAWAFLSDLKIDALREALHPGGESDGSDPAFD